MSALREFLVVAPLDEQWSRSTVKRTHAEREVVPGRTSVHDEQIHRLVQQLFFQPEADSPRTELVRHVGFSAVEGSTATAGLCLEVARALACEDKYDVALIDTHSDPVLLQNQLRIPSPPHEPPAWPIGQRLWMIPRQSWLPDAREQRVTDQSLSRLRDLMTEFDFSILWCAPVSWLMTGIGQTCDGLVLVLTANKTRRLVAAQVKEQLRKAKVPLLGTVLAERRFPVPRSLYRNL